MSLDDDRAGQPAPSLFPELSVAGRPQRTWIAVASAGHVRRGRTQGFMQVCHGKSGPLARVRPGDRMIYYSPTETFGGRDRLQAFTAIGIVSEGAPYRVDMGGGFRPWRRDVLWLDTHEAPIRSLVGTLAFTSGPGWGAQLRFGLVAITQDDGDAIAWAMGIAQSV